MDAEIAAVAITDHHFIDTGRIRQLQQIAGDDLTIFPGIELRCELGGRKGVHFIGIFAEDANLDVIWIKLQGNLSIHPHEVKSIGDDKVYVPFVKGATLIKELGGVVSVHADSKSNSFDNIPSDPKYREAFKDDMARAHIDIFDVPSSHAADTYRTKVFPTLNFTAPVIMCSDNHNISTYSQAKNSWIKADLTFEGLRHVLIEPEGRVFLGPVPPALDRVRRNRTKYVRGITFSRSSMQTTKEVWFHDSVAFNHELVAVIGNKGSGKSALTDIVGLLGHCGNSGEFSFLHKDKFRGTPNKAKSFNAELEWETGDTNSSNLADDVDANAVARVKYLPQNYVERICNELGTEADRFTEELESVIFSHVDDAERLGQPSLNDLIEYRTGETQRAIDNLRARLRRCLGEYLGYAEAAKPANRTRMDNLLAQKKAELGAHTKVKPKEVAKPEASEEEQKRVDAIHAGIEKIANEIKALEAKAASLTKSRVQITQKLASIERLVGALANLDAYFAQFKLDHEEDFRLLGLAFEDHVKLQVDVSGIKAVEKELRTELASINQQLDPTNTNGPEAQRIAKEAKIAEQKQKLDEPNLVYQNYLKALKDWEVAEKALIGDATAPGTVRFYEKSLEALDALPAKMEAKKQERDEIAGKIHAELVKLRDVYRGLYKPVQEFIDGHHQLANELSLEFHADLEVRDFAKVFLGFINRTVGGSFAGVAEGQSRLESIVKESDFESAEGVMAFLGRMDKELNHDRRNAGPDEEGEPVEPSGQLVKGKALVDLLSYLYSLEYLHPAYDLRWAGKRIELLSPGERGALLLVFYLLIDRNDIPLLIDQPEGNLDNQTVYNVLVPCIKEAKQRRQIIMVTHNPNLAVVCDAEQIVCASLDKQGGNKVSYAMGAIENPKMNRMLLDILEGTEPAFDNRDAKYRRKKTRKA
jgi:ABC-type lipoprotein export system ATPase subunit